MATRVFYRPADGVFIAPKPKRPVRAGLRGLVPTAYRPDGETNDFLQRYKQKWLSQLDFSSASHIESLLMLSFMMLALGRDGEAEVTADQIVRHVDVRRAGDETRAVVVTAMHLSAWLKTKRQADCAVILARAKALGRDAVQRDREWLTNDAAGEIEDALLRKRLGYLAYPFAGIVLWLNDPAGRSAAEPLLARGLEAVRALMR